MAKEIENVVDVVGDITPWWWSKFDSKDVGAAVAYVAQMPAVRKMVLTRQHFLIHVPFKPGVDEHIKAIRERLYGFGDAKARAQP